MRQVRIAASAHAFFQSMLEQGAEKFGIPVAQEKERIVHDTLHGTVPSIRTVAVTTSV